MHPIQMRTLYSFPCPFSRSTNTIWHRRLLRTDIFRSNNPSPSARDDGRSTTIRHTAVVEETQSARFCLPVIHATSSGPPLDATEARMDGRDIRRWWCVTKKMENIRVRGEHLIMDDARRHTIPRVEPSNRIRATLI